MPTRRFLAFVVPFLAVLAGGLAVPVRAGAAPGDGTPDPSFGSGGARVFAWDRGGALSDWVHDGVADDNGNLFLVGSFNGFSGNDDWGILELDATGAFVNWQYFVFDLGGSNTDVATAVRLDGAGGLLIAGQARTATGAEVRLCRLRTSDLTLDLSFANGAGCAAYSYLATGLYAVALARAGDGGWLVAGQLDWGGGDSDFFVVKFTSAGLLDTNFNWLDLFHPGMAVVPVDLVAGGHDVARAIAVDHQGRILVAGNAQSPLVSNAAAVVRLTASGNFDPIGTNGKQIWAYFDGSRSQPTFAMTVTVDPVLDTFLVGYSHYTGNPNEVAAVVGHFSADGIWWNFPGLGSPNAYVTWQPGGYNWLARVLVQCDGRILAVGDSSLGQTYQVTRLLPNGTVDASYGVSGTASFSPSLQGFGSGHGVASATLSAGRLVLTGTVSRPDEDWLAVRLTSDLIFCDGFQSVP